MEQCIVVNSTFRDSDLRKMSFCRSVVNNTGFSRCDLTGAQFIDCQLNQTVWQGATLDYAAFNKATMEMAILTEVNARNADFSDVNFTYADLSLMNLHDALMLDTQLFGADLFEIIDYKTVWTGANRNKAKAVDEKRLAAYKKAQKEKS